MALPPVVLFVAKLKVPPKSSVSTIDTGGGQATSNFRFAVAVWPNSSVTV